ncbi:hypothetical protein [Comamonas thiooxydans]|uniref:hypothetical protein n=1 Tax=Comamonas thiooxydans TaxID=363952 RepID=UPI00103E4C8D|nr:hypothetical protein [Comamonas thiooxydans]
MTPKQTELCVMAAGSIAILLGGLGPMAWEELQRSNGLKLLSPAELKVLAECQKSKAESRIQMLQRPINRGDLDDFNLVCERERERVDQKSDLPQQTTLIQQAQALGLKSK